MKLKSEKATLLATDLVKSKKGNMYAVGLFQKGIDTLKLMLPEDNTNPVTQKDYDLELDYNTAYKQLTLVAFNEVV